MRTKTRTGAMEGTPFCIVRHCLRPWLVMALMACSDVPAVPAQDVPQRRSIEELRLGSDEGELTFQRILDVARGEGGRLLVVQTNEPSLLELDPQSTSTRHFGRAGRGPGEFQRPTHVGVLNDTVWVADGGSGALTAIDSSLALGFVVTPRLLTGTSGGAQALRAMGPLADGTVLATTAQSSMSMAGSAAATLPLLRMSRDGEILDTLASLEVGTGVRMIQRAGGGGMMVFAQRLTSDDPLWNIAADGSGVILVERSVATQRDDATFRVRKVAPSDDVAFERRFPYAPTVLSAAMKDSIVDEAAGALVRAGMYDTRSSAASAVRDAFYLPAFLPPVRSLVTSSDGRIWLEIYPRTPEATNWLLLSADGHLVATLELPARHQVIEAYEDELWTVMYDALDVPVLVRHGLSRQ